MAITERGGFSRRLQLFVQRKKVTDLADAKKSAISSQTKPRSNLPS
jgi:hypothetical protein